MNPSWTAGFEPATPPCIENGAYRLLGRSSVDIIKSGGHKISALEIEEVLRTHPAIAECVVVGVDDLEWGQRVCCAAELRPHVRLELEELREWSRTRLAPYKIPKDLRVWLGCRETPWAKSSSLRLRHSLLDLLHPARPDILSRSTRWP